MRDYELMYIVRPDVDEDGVNAAVESVNSLIGSHGGEIVKTTMWGKRRLAYEVKHLRDGYYVIANMRLDAEKIVPIERTLRIHDTVFRHLIVAQAVPTEPDEPDVAGSGSVIAPPPEIVIAVDDDEDDAIVIVADMDLDEEDI